MSRPCPLSTVLLLSVALLGTVAPLPAAEEAGALLGLEGERLTEADLADGATILVVWTSWSPRCRDVGERVERIAERWRERARVGTVNFQEDEATAREFARRQKIRVPVYLDRDAAFAKRHAVTSLPFLLVIEDGKAVFSGKLPADADGAIGRALE